MKSRDLACSLFTLSFAATLTLFGVGCAAPVEGDEALESEDPTAIEVADSPVTPQAGGVVIPGEPIIRTCTYKCTPFCKTMPSGRKVCGETCICIFN